MWYVKWQCLLQPCAHKGSAAEVISYLHRKKKHSSAKIATTPASKVLFAGVEGWFTLPSAAQGLAPSSTLCPQVIFILRLPVLPQAQAIPSTPK